jgi:hypothetical protein
VEKTFGKKRVKVTASIDGIPYRGSLVRMGGDRHILGILKAIRGKAGKTIGDMVEITLREDLEPREAAVPEDLQKALRAASGSYGLFQKLSYSHRKEYINWIDEAKRSETRKKRIAETVRRLDEK